MVERTGIVSFQGSPLTLQGKELCVGDHAPDFSAVDVEMKPCSLADFTGRKLILASVPSLDTPVCDMETRRFNTEAMSLGEDVKIVTLSMDLPFAQKRWCGAAGVEAVQTLSDHRLASFGTAYGVLIKELRLLARAVFVVNPAGVVQYSEYVPDITQEPDYDAVLRTVKSMG